MSSWLHMYTHTHKHVLCIPLPQHHGSQSHRQNPILGTQPAGLPRIHLQGLVSRVPSLQLRSAPYDHICELELAAILGGSGKSLLKGWVQSRHLKANLENMN